MFFSFTVVCPGGEEYNEDFKRCDPCSVGKYKPSENRFGSCLNCTVGYITDGGGKMLESDCNIRKYNRLNTDLFLV